LEIREGDQGEIRGRSGEIRGRSGEARERPDACRWHGGMRWRALATALSSTWWQVSCDVPRGAYTAGWRGINLLRHNRGLGARGGGECKSMYEASTEGGL
jgi:hypothetical protein